MTAITTTSETYRADPQRPTGALSAQSVFKNQDNIVYLQAGGQPPGDQSAPPVICVREQPTNNQSALSKVIDRRMSELTASLGMYLGGGTLVVSVLTGDPAVFVGGVAATVAVVAVSSLVTQGMQVLGDAAIDGGSYLIRLPIRAVCGVGSVVIETVKQVYRAVV